MNQQTPDTLDAAVAAACRRAAGLDEVPPGEPLIQVIAASRDVNARGRVRHRWYRLAYVPGDGQAYYFCQEREPKGTFRASDRHWTGYGEVPAGALLLQHDHGGPVSLVWLVVGPDQIVKCDFGRRADGQLGVTLPDGQIVVIPDPRARK